MPPSLTHPRHRVGSWKGLGPARKASNCPFDGELSTDLVRAGPRGASAGQGGRVLEGLGDGAADETAVRRTVRGESVPASWRPVTRGVRCRATHGAAPFRLELLAWQGVLPPDARWTRLTAARLHGWWLPPVPRDLAVFASHSARHRVRRQGLMTIRRRSVGEFDVIDVAPGDHAAGTIIH